MTLISPVIQDVNSVGVQENISYLVNIISGRITMKWYNTGDKITSFDSFSVITPYDWSPFCIYHS